MFATHTGSFPVGFRRGWSDWQRDIDAVIHWARANGFGHIDLGPDADVVGKAVRDAGLNIGSADLLDWKSLLSGDKGKRQEAIARNSQFIAACAALGVSRYFIVMLPEKPELPRRENFAFMLHSMAELAPVLEKHRGHLVIEGWPGPGALCCTPEGYRALFAEIPSAAIGVNYDPSHLMRMGIDPIRFIDEFADRTFHVHGKDAELSAEGRYEYGTEQPPTFATPPGFGAMHWRYTIPGHGQMRWTRALEILAQRKYAGVVSIELEDRNFNGTTEGEQRGLLASAQFLQSC